MKPLVIAFDCFGTVFDMSTVSKDEIRAYVNHVRNNDFSPFEFPSSWWSLKAHPDSAEGIKLLQSNGFECVAASNGSVSLLEHIAKENGIEWDFVIDFAKHGVYKPNQRAYHVIRYEAFCEAERILMVTANPTFGDVEGALSVWMAASVIRQPDKPATIIELAESLIKLKDN